MLFFENMSRKQKRKFNKLSPEEQAPIIEAELIQKVSQIMAKEIANSMIRGMNLLWTQLFEDFVIPLDNVENDDEWHKKISELLSLIRTQYLRIEASKAKENENEE